MVEINYVCSLGQNCHSAFILKQNNYKLCSYPFDWVFSSPEIIIDSVKDNFKKFLDKSYYVDIGNNKCGHSHYVSNMFWHHNPLNNQEDYNYFGRCINRFTDLLKKEEHKLFYMMLNCEENDNIKDRMVEFNNEFSKHTSNYTVLVIMLNPNKKLNYHKFTYDNNIHFLEIHMLGTSNGIRFTHENDGIYLNCIVNTTYKFNIKG